MRFAGPRFLSYWILHLSYITDKPIQYIWQKQNPVQLYKLLVSAAKTTIWNSWCYFLWRALYIGQDLHSFNYLWVYRTLMLQYYLYRMTRIGTQNVFSENRNKQAACNSKKDEHKCFYTHKHTNTCTYTPYVFTLSLFPDLPLTVIFAAN